MPLLWIIDWIIDRRPSAGRHQRPGHRRGRRGGSKRRADTLRAIAKLEARWADRRRDWCEKTSLALVRGYDTITFENLRIPNMVRSAKGTVDAPGSNIAAKSGLNRSIAESCWGQLARRTQDKAEASGVVFLRVEAVYTSQQCSHCGHTDTANRPSRDRFVCAACGHESHADINAATNIDAAGPVVNGRGKQTSMSVDRQSSCAMPRRKPIPKGWERSRSVCQH